MKFTLVRTTALDVFNQALKTCNTKAVGEALSEFLFEEKDGSLQLSSMGDISEQTISLPVAKDANGKFLLQAEEGAKFTVSGKEVTEFVNQFPDEEITCLYVPAEGTFIMGSATRKTRVALVTGIVDDFVPMVFTSRDINVACAGAALAEALKHTAFATATDPNLAPKTAVRVKITGELLVAHATDEERISAYVVDIDDIGGTVVDILLPRSTSEILSASLLRKGVDGVEIELGKRHARFKWNDVVLTSRLENPLGAGFPEVSGYFNGQEIASIKVSKGDFLRALKLVGMIAKDSYIFVSTNADGVLVSTEEANHAAIQDMVVAQESKGEAVTTLPCKSLIKAIESTSNPFVILSYRALPGQQDGEEPGLVIMDGDTYQHFIFPVVPNDQAEEVLEDDTDDEEE